MILLVALSPYADIRVVATPFDSEGLKCSHLLHVVALSRCRVVVVATLNYCLSEVKIYNFYFLFGERTVRDVLCYIQ